MRKYTYLRSLIWDYKTVFIEIDSDSLVLSFLSTTKLSNVSVFKM